MRKPSDKFKRALPEAPRAVHPEGGGPFLTLPREIRLRAAGLRSVIRTVEEAIGFIDKELNPALARLPRWTFARALLDEALRTGKSRDLDTAARQLRQALHNEKWLVEHKP